MEQIGNTTGKIIFKTVVGSQAYGTATPESDIDIKGVYLQNPDEILTFGYQPQIIINKDETYYEIRKFFELVMNANPTMLELLYSPKDCIQILEPEYQMVMDYRDIFLTTRCYGSFGMYGKSQIKKARGLDKMMNWENERMVRKSPIDFVHIYEDGQTRPIVEWLNMRGLKQEFCGLIALNHFRDAYALYYDQKAHDESLVSDMFHPIGFKGIVMDNSNTIRLSSIPKGMKDIGIISYNKCGYTVHCSDYKKYTKWLKARNTNRYVDVKNHDQQIDGKNVSHCIRLVEIATEIPILKTINIRRPNAEYLLKIKKGEYPLDDLIAKANVDIANLKELYANCDLPKTVDKEFVKKLLLDIRHYAV